MQVRMLFERMIQDLRYAVRMLFKAPGFTLVAVSTLALGIGANTAVFSVVNGVLIHPLRFPNADQLVVLFENKPHFERGSVPYFNYLDWQRMSRSFQSLAAYRRTAEFNLTGQGAARQVQTEMVSHEFFPTLDLNPALGRSFSAEEDRLHGRKVVMVSSGFWKRNFASSPDVIGKTLNLNGDSYEVIGVAPEFTLAIQNFAETVDVFYPIGAWDRPDFQGREHSLGLDVIGRLKAGVTFGEARADVERVGQDLAVAYPSTNKGVGITMITVREAMTGNIRPILLVLLASVGFVLLIGCVNVANLMLARAIGRSREFAIRCAVGASKQQLVRQMLTESVVLAVVGGVLGLGVAVLGTNAVLNVMPRSIPRGEEIGIDLNVLIFTFVISVLTGIFFGFAPALKVSRPDLQEALKEGSRASSGTAHKAQSVFVIAEIAMALILLVGAGLMLRTLSSLWGVDPGFDSHHVLNFSIALPPADKQKSPEAIQAHFRDIEQRITALPGIEAMSYSEGATPFQDDSEEQFWIHGEPKPTATADMKWMIQFVVEPSYLQTMRLRLKSGRFLSSEDKQHSPRVAVVDEMFAFKYFSGQNPIGKVIDTATYGPTEIVGVVNHVNQWGLNEDGTSNLRAELYMPIAQLDDDSLRDTAQYQKVLIRTAGDPSSQVNAIRNELAGIDPNIVGSEAHGMDFYIERSLGSIRFSMILLGLFAAIALLLAVIGIYGVMSYAIGQRTHEIGIRMALGARPADVLSMIVKQGSRMAIIGIIIGVVGAAILTRAMSSMLFGVTANDPLTFIAVAFILLLMAVVACLVPARRATRVDPLVVLRYE